MLIFKYLAPEGAEKVLEQNDRLSLKFGMPREYNDPYELFLQPSSPLGTEELRAFFEFFFGRVVQAPVSCFSMRPECVPMWAHYAKQGEGIVLGFDEDALAAHFSLAYFADVDYSDSPASVDAGMIEWAFTTGKRRHAIRLLAHAHRAAFFRKRLEWQYERERRLVVATDEVSESSGLLLAMVPSAVLRFVIVGPRTPPDLRARCAWFGTNLGIPLLEFVVGRRSYDPLFRRLDGSVLRWDGSDFLGIKNPCSSCSEPSDDLDGAGQCEWCRIDDEVRRTAAKRSMLAATLYFGLDRGLPLEFEGLSPKGKGAAAWTENAPRRQTEALLQDVRLTKELFDAMGRAGMLEGMVGRQIAEPEEPVQRIDIPSLSSSRLATPDSEPTSC